MKTKLSIIYVYYNTPVEILNSIKSIKKATGKISYEIIIVDNNSSLKLPKEVKLQKKINIIRNKENFGYGKGANIGARYAQGEYLLIVNPDTEFTKNSIKGLIDRVQQDKKIGIIGPKIIDSKNQTLPSISGMPFLPAGIFIYSFLNTVWKNNPYSKKFWLYSSDRNKEQLVEVVSGACMMIKKDLFKKIGGFDESFFMYFEESDICFRIKKESYKILFYPNSKVYHFIGKSSDDNEWIEETFQKSRFEFFKKYHGFTKAILAESFLRLTNKYSLLLIFILLVSAFLNLYKINELMMFQGDFGRDYLAARDMLLTGKIPLIGIQSSVVWLHQGPLSIYFIGLAFLIGRFNPIVPAILYGLIGICSTFLVYKIGKTFFNKNIGLLASAFFATSPLIVVNARMPYHTSSIPFFSLLLFLLIYKFIKGNNAILPLLFFVLGILFLLELSNGVLFFLLAIVLLAYRRKIKKRDILKSSLGFILGITPFVIYDMSHNFVQTGGFVLWVINRIRLFFGLTISGNSTTIHFKSAVITVYEQINRIIFPESQIIVGLLLIAGIILVSSNKSFCKRYKNGLILTALWIIVPLLGFIVHAQPGTAYFPLVFSSIALLIGITFHTMIVRFKLFILLFLFLITSNIVFILQNEYFLTTKNKINALPPNPYSFGLDYSLINETSNFILSDSKNNQFKLQGGGFLSQYKSSIDNYKYLLLYKEGKISDNASQIYTVFENKKEIPSYKKIIYTNTYVYVTKDEKK